MEATDVIGSGTYGEVHEILYDEQPVALKVYKRQNGGIYYSLKEIDILFRVKSPFLPPGIDLISKHQDSEIFGDNLTGIIMPLYEGNLYEYEISDATQKLKIAEKILKDIAAGLSALEKAGYYHLDVKPENILFKDDNFYLVDYGLCIPKDSHNPVENLIEVDMAGTYEYLPLEVINGKVSSKSACWSLALSVIEFITDKAHFESEEINLHVDGKPCLEKVKQQIHQIRKIALNNLEKWNKQNHIYDTDLSSLLQQMLELNYRDRISYNDILNHTPQIQIPVVKIKDYNFFRQCYFVLAKIFEQRGGQLREFCLALTIMIRLLTKNRINPRMNFVTEVEKCYETAAGLYQDSSQYIYLKPEKKILNFIKELDCCIFYNPIFINLGTTEKILEYLKHLMLEPELYINIFEIEPEPSVFEKNVVFPFQTYIDLYED